VRQLLAQGAPASTPALAWIAVRQRFTQFHNNLSLTPAQFLDGMTKRNGVLNALNRRYYGSTSDTHNSFLIGSWGKDTAMQPPRDVDLYFLLPVAVHTRFQTHLWHRLIQQNMCSRKPLSLFCRLPLEIHTGNSSAIKVLWGGAFSPVFLSCGVPLPLFLAPEFVL
jgi:hypothetical protein